MRRHLEVTVTSKTDAARSARHRLLVELGRVLKLSYAEVRYSLDDAQKLIVKKSIEGLAAVCRKEDEQGSTARDEVELWISGAASNIHEPPSDKNPSDAKKVMASWRGASISDAGRLAAIGIPDFPSLLTPATGQDSGISPPLAV